MESFSHWLWALLLKQYIVYPFLRVEIWLPQKLLYISTFKDWIFPDIVIMHCMLGICQCYFRDKFQSLRSNKLAGKSLWSISNNLWNDKRSCIFIILSGEYLIRSYHACFFQLIYSSKNFKFKTLTYSSVS